MSSLERIGNNLVDFGCALEDKKGMGQHGFVAEGQKLLGYLLPHPPAHACCRYECRHL